MTKTKASIEGRMPRVITGELVVSSSGNQALTIKNNFHPYQAAAELANIMNGPAPKNFISSWFRKHKNKMETERLNTLTAFVNQYVAYNDAVTNARYRMAINQITLQRMIEGRIEQMEMEAQAFRAEHEAKLARLRHEENVQRKELEKHDIDIIRARNEAAKILIIAEAEAVAIKARAGVDIARAERERATTDMIKSITSAGIDVNTASLVAASIYSAILGSSGKIDVESIVQEKLSDGLKRELDAKVRTAVAKAEKEEYTSRKMEHDIESEIRDDEATTGGPIRSR